MKHLAILAKLVSFAAVLVFSNPVLADDNHTPIGDGVKDLPLFDAHIHYKQPAWEAYPVESVIELMNNNGVAMALVSSTPDGYGLCLSARCTTCRLAVLLSQSS